MHPTPLPRPTREQIALMPPYERLPLQRVHVVRTAEQAAVALRQLAASGFVGFDTETRPVFSRDATSSGPHVLQLATLDEAFIVLLHAAAPMAFVREVLESPELVKVGFGLNSDRSPLARQFDIHLAGTIELAQAVRRLGYREMVGVKAAVAIVLGQRLQKSKKATTSNWALPELSASQLQYAADDAHAALAVFFALGCPMQDLQGAAPLAPRAA